MAQITFRSRKAKIAYQALCAELVGANPTAKAAAEAYFKPQAGQSLSAHAVRLEKPEAVKTTTLGSVPQPVARHLHQRHRQAAGFNAL